MIMKFDNSLKPEEPLYSLVFFFKSLSLIICAREKQKGRRRREDDEDSYESDTDFYLY